MSGQKGLVVPNVGAASGASGSGEGATPLAPEPLGSLGFGISFGGVTGVAGTTGPLPHGLASQQPWEQPWGAPHPQECFDIRARILSRRFGRAEPFAQGSQHDEDFAPHLALSRSRSFTRPPEAHGSQHAGAGAAPQQPPA